MLKLEASEQLRQYLERYAKCLRCNLAHFGMQALPHFNASVSNTDTAIEEDADKSTCLVHGLEGESDAKLCGKHC
jgi:hypothetical protein